MYGEEQRPWLRLDLPLPRPCKLMYILLQSHHRDSTFNGLINFSLFYLILSFRLQTIRRISTRSHLSHTLHIFTNTCLPHGKPYAIKLNFILDSSFLCSAWLCCHTCTSHILCFSSILPPPCSYIMSLMSVMPALDSIGRSGTNMYILYDSI